MSETVNLQVVSGIHLEWHVEDGRIVIDHGTPEQFAQMVPKWIWEEAIRADSTPAPNRETKT